MTDYLDEEQQIMNEQDTAAPSFSFETFYESIDKMKLTKPVIISPNETVKTAVDLLVNKNKGSLMVCNADGSIVGIVTERDVMMKVSLSDKLANEPVAEIMTSDPLCLHREDEIAYILNNMHVGGYRHIPIVDNDDIPIAIVSIRHIMDYIIDHFPQNVLNMVGEPFRGTQQRDGA